MILLRIYLVHWLAMWLIWCAWTRRHWLVELWGRQFVAAAVLYAARVAA